MKKLMFLIIFFVIKINIYSNPIDTVLAKKIALNYFEFLNPSRPNIEIQNTIIKYYNGYPSYYIINFIGGGYVIVSANDATTPILAYSYDDTYYVDEIHSPAYELWMKNYSREIDSVREYNVDNSVAINEWNNILNKNFSQYKGTMIVPPLITSRWGQSFNNSGSGSCPGYNYFCPSFSASQGCDCQRCDAGCGPIAMAQVMRYWKHPTYSTYSPYDWCNMPDMLTSSSSMVEVEAVARLIRDCGDKANVNYCVAEWAGGCATSLFPPEKIRNTLVKDFGYHSNAKCAERFYYSKKKWIKKLKENLNNGRPVIYAAWEGLKPWTGHYFIFDGYNSDNKFHINWGWWGKYQYDSDDDNWYEIGDLTPGSHNYNFNQEAIFNLYPAWTINCNGVVNMSNNTITGTSGYYELTSTYLLSGTITANNTIISAETPFSFKAYNEIILEDGFKVEAGANFVAEIIDCPVSCDNSKRLMESTAPPYTEEYLTNLHNYKEEKTLNIVQQDSVIFEIKPNPFSNNAFISFNIEKDFNVRLYLVNIYGIKVKDLINNYLYKGTYNVPLSASDLTQGIYYCILETENGRSTIIVMKM